MQANKSCDTKPELALGRLLWTAGVRYRKHPRDVAGKPDFCIKKYKLAIFVDGEFWHGRDWEHRRQTLKSNREFWIRKIERNIERDRMVNFALERAGWRVFRFWETDIKKHPGRCLAEVLGYLSRWDAFFAPSYIPSDYADENLPAAAEEAASYGKGDD